MLTVHGPLSLGFALPLAADPLVAWFANRAVDGVADVRDGVVHRTLSLPGGPARVRLAVGSTGVSATLELTAAGDVAEAVERCRRMLDLDADPAAVDAHLGRDPRLAPLVADRPGLRVPGWPDAEEAAVLAVLGQQISTAAARTLAGRLVSRVGDPVDLGGVGPTRLFPTAAAVAAADLDGLGMPRRRAATVRALATALADGTLDLGLGADRDAVRERLLAIPGVGPWTADYVLLRAVGDRDALPTTDLVLRQEAARRDLDLDRDGGRWRPWRAYAAQHLWCAAASAPPRPRRARAAG